MNNSRNTRILSFFLSLLMAVSVLASLTVLPVWADEEQEPDSTEEAVTDPSDDSEGSEGEEDDESETPVKEYLTVEEAINTYLTNPYNSREEKLATMTLKLTRGDLELYCDKKTGEVAVKNTKTGQILLSNPYDAATASSDSVKAELLSQIVISFKDLANSGTSRTMYSFTESAQRGQIDVKNIKNGIRLEYTLGKEASKKLMPLWVEASRFETMILANISDETTYNRFMTYYTRVDINDETVQSIIDSNLEQYPIVGKTYSQVGYTPTVTETTVKQVGGTESTYTYSQDKYVSIYVIDSKAVQSERESNLLEGITKSYCPDYNYEEQDFDVTLTGYVGEDGNTAIFRMALEYYLTDTGFEVKLPANGISFDEEAYQLTNISVLQYLGASSNDNTGYTFIPDGSGTIIRNEDIAAVGKGYTVTGQIYGPDYAYHTLTYNGKSEIMRLPVYGTIENTTYYTDKIIGSHIVYQTDDSGNLVLDEDGNKIPTYVLFDEEAVPVTPITNEEGETVYYITDTLKKVEAAEGEPAGQTADEETDADTGDDDGTTADPTTSETPAYNYEVTPDSVVAQLVAETGTDGKTVLYAADEDGDKIKVIEYEYESYEIPQGFVAIIDAGESLANITSNHGGNVLHKYNSVYATFYPLSTDSYNLRDAISVGNDAEWTVTSERKYTGSFEINIILVSDYENSAYAGSYEGMAKAYQDYLIANQGLEKLSNTAADIPLYIESFGMIATQGTFLTIPVWIDTPLTTCEDIQSMYGRLSEQGITNVNFRLTGFTEGGMDYRLTATSVDFEKVVGGKKGYNALVEDAQSKGYGVFPDFDFVYAEGSSWFDGFSYSKWTVRTIDGRYASKRAYDATYQSFQYVGSVAVSPWAYDLMFEKFVKEMSDYKVDGVSFSTLGSDLNSDFDKDDPYNREDDKQYTIELLKSLSEQFDNIMVDGGNAYTYGYVEHILNLPLDGSRYLRSSQSVPFIGMVLHGYVNYAGTPTNMEGDIDYEILKIIENGASPYFILSAQNTNELKNWSYVAQYYSVNFDIWFDDLVEIYNTINDALKDVQTSAIVGHKFVDGMRVLTEAEQLEVEAAETAAREAYNVQKNADLVKAIRAAVKAGEFELPEDYVYIAEDGSVIIPDEFDIATFEAEYATFEETYDPGLDAVIDDHTIVYETYENGIAFLLNYNSFDVTVELNGTTYTVGALDFVKIPKA